LKRLPFVKKPRCVVTYHQPTSLLNKYARVRVLPHVDSIVLLSNEQRNYFTAYGVTERLQYIPHGVDSAYFAPKEFRKTKGPEDSFKILTAGKWLRDFDAYFKVVRLLAGEGITFYLIGNPLQEKETCSYPNLKICSGYISDDDFLEMYNSVDAVFLPFEDAAANNVLLEGLSCGLPVITTDLPATREYLDEECAFFVESNDSEVFAAKIRLLMQDNEKQRHMSKAAKERSQVYAWEKIVKQLEDVSYVKSKEQMNV